MELQEHLQKTITGDITHAHYTEVCNLSEKYKAFISNKPNEDGELPLNAYLRQFVRREDDDLFDQRKNLTKHYTPAICAQIMKPFNKVVRSNKVVKLIDNKEAAKVEEIEKSLVTFFLKEELTLCTRSQREELRSKF